MTLQDFSSEEEVGLSVLERFQAASAGLKDDSFDPRELGRLSAVAGAVLLVLALIALLVARGRRLRWVTHHAQRLREVGLHGDEVATFRSIARCAEGAQLPLLCRNRGAFDVAAAEYVRRVRPHEARRDELSQALALRRRIHFDLRIQGPPVFERGQALLLCMRTREGRLARLNAVVLGTPPHTLQIALEDAVTAQKLGRLLHTGQELVLVVQRDRIPCEARVRVRGRCSGRTLQLLVDRPTALSPARVRIAWNGADENVQVEFVERFSERLVGDEVPAQAASIVASCNDGIVLRFDHVRPRHGESVRVVDGPFAGFYRGFVALRPRGRGGEVFVIRRGAERADPAGGPERATGMKKEKSA